MDCFLVWQFCGMAVFCCAQTFYNMYIYIYIIYIFIYRYIIIGLRASDNNIITGVRVYEN